MSLLDKLDGPGSEYPITESIKDWIADFKITQPHFPGAALATTELFFTGFFLVHAWWNIDFIASSGTPTPLVRPELPPWKYKTWTMEEWLAITAGMTSAATALGYDGGHRIGKITGKASVGKKRENLELASDLERYLMVENGVLIEALKPHRTFNKFFKKAGPIGLKGSILANILIWSDVLLYHLGKVNGAFGLDMAQIWNMAAYLLLLPSTVLMTLGRVYQGSEKTDVMGVKPNYKYGTSVLEEFTILKGIYACQELYGVDISITGIKNFLNNNYIYMNLYPENREDKLLRIRDKSCRKYALENILGKVTKKKIIDCVDKLNYDLSYKSEKYVQKIKKKSGKKILKLTDSGWELLNIFDAFGVTGRKGAGFYRYMDKKYNTIHAKRQISKTLPISWNKYILPNN
jgi:hypothetical protein